MTLQVLGASQIDQLDKQSIKDALKSAFAGLTTGASVQPEQTVTVFPADAGDAIFYPGVLWASGVVGVKVSPYITALGAAGKSPVTAYTLLLSVETGEPVLLCDSLALTTARTAATTSLALDYLIPSGAKSLAVIGSGKIAREHLSYALAQHEWNDVSVFSPSLVESPEKRDKIASIDRDIAFPSNAERAVRDADVVLLCTSSGTPVVETPWLKNVQVVTSISTNVPKAHEVDPATLEDFNVFCDFKRTAPTTAGDFIIATQEFGWSPDRIVADLPELILQGGKVVETGRPAYFRSTGLGIEDLAIAALLASL
jgi:L-arginine dehydrogenase